MNHSSNRGVRLTVAFIIGFVSLVTVIFFASQWQMKRQPNPQSYRYAATVFNQPRAIGHFQFETTDGPLLDESRLKQHWTMMFFGFTRCPMMCPTAMKTLADMYRTLESSHTTPLPQVVMVSLDPDRDDLPTMRRYLTAFHPNFVGARSDERQLQQVTKALGVVHQTINGPDGGVQDIQHSGAVMVFNPQGELAAFFNWPLAADSMVKDYQHMVS